MSSNVNEAWVMERPVTCTAQRDSIPAKTFDVSFNSPR